jgi:hypothetical protein
MEACLNCSFGETCNKDSEKIHCNKYNVSFTKYSKCDKHNKINKK